MQFISQSVSLWRLVSREEQCYKGEAGDFGDAVLLWSMYASMTSSVQRLQMVCLLIFALAEVQECTSS